MKQYNVDVANEENVRLLHKHQEQMTLALQLKKELEVVREAHREALSLRQREASYTARENSEHVPPVIPGSNSLIQNASDRALVPQGLVMP